MRDAREDSEVSVPRVSSASEEMREDLSVILGSELDLAQLIQPVSEQNLAVFGWVLGPITIAMAQTQQGRPFPATLWRLWSHGSFEPGPLWFCEALLILSGALVVWQQLLPPHAAHASQSPSNRTLLAAALLTGAAAFLLRLAWPVGTEWHALQLGYFASYVVLFVGGMQAAPTRWVERPAHGQVRLWRRVMWVALPVLPVLALSATRFPALQRPAEGGWTVLAAVYAFWEPLVAWGIILGLLARFQYRLQPGPGWRALSDRSYTIFIVHPPVVVGATIAFQAIEAPALVKFMMTGVSSCLVCFVLAGWLLRVPGVRRVL